MIKSYTDIEQSKKLAEILPLESADMHYGNFSPKGLGYEDKLSAGLTSYIKEIKVYEELKEHYKIKDYNGIVAWKVIPCWSLAALLGVLPIVDLCTPTLKMKLNHKYYMELCIDYANHKYISTNDYDNPVDACVSMIERLHELNLL